MELWNNEVKLTRRRERRALLTDSRSVSAGHIGALWRAALKTAENKLSKERENPTKPYVEMDIYGTAYYTGGGESINSLERTLRLLQAMEPNVLGIERDTLPSETEQQQEL